MTDSERWLVQLTDNNINEITTAVKASRQAEKPTDDLLPIDFPLEDFGIRLARLKNELLNGHGFSLLCGLPADQSTDEDLLRAFRGISTCIGNSVSQSTKTHQPTGVIDQPFTSTEGKRIHQTHRAQPFHSNPCKITGLLCLRAAKHGGADSVASSAAIHNELLDNDPAALEQLYGSFDCDRYGEIPDGEEPTYAVKIFKQIDNHLICCAMDPEIRSAQRIERVPRLTDEQIQALDAFQQAASRLSLNLLLQRGDIMFFNTMTTVHSRRTFVDYSAADKCRHFIKLYLS